MLPVPRFPRRYRHETHVVRRGFVACLSACWPASVGASCRWGCSIRLRWNEPFRAPDRCEPCREGGGHRAPRRTSPSRVRRAARAMSCLLQTPEGQVQEAHSISAASTSRRRCRTQLSQGSSTRAEIRACQPTVRPWMPCSVSELEWLIISGRLKRAHVCRWQSLCPDVWRRARGGINAHPGRGDKDDHVAEPAPAIDGPYERKRA